MTTPELQQRRRACQAFGVSTKAVDAELKSRRGYAPDPAEQRRIQAARDWYRDQFRQGAMKAVDGGFFRRSRQPLEWQVKAELEKIALEYGRLAIMERTKPRRERRLMYGPGATAGSTSIYWVEE